jgi:hypothetical protein
MCLLAGVRRGHGFAQEGAWLTDTAGS